MRRTKKAELLTALVLLSMLVFSPGCQRPSATTGAIDEPAIRRPTATEVFELRSKCADLGEQIRRRNLVEPGQTSSQVSHYDPKTNRCYVELDVNMADLTKFEDHYSRYLYDGQTRELLASTTSDKGIKWAFLKDGQSPFDYNAVTAKIDSLMADDRKH